MKRLPGADAFFLFSERPAWPMHVGSLILVDRSEAPSFDLEAVRSVISERLALVPSFAMKVKEVPFGLDTPLLVGDPDFNVDYHLHHIAVPAPGAPRQLGELVGDLTEVQLDRRRPLWELWYIDGVEGGQVALFFKVHHCLIDGVSGAGLAELICDLEPEPPPRPTPLPPRPTPERAPNDVELLMRGLVSASTSPLRFARWAVDTSRRTVRNVQLTRKRGGRTALNQAPRAPWNGVLGPLRRFAYVSVSLDDIKAVRRALDVKVNDVVLALAAEALRRYLAAHDALPDEPLVALVPMSMRAEGDTDLGTKILTTYASLETHIEDPVERVRAIARGMQTAKEITNALKAKEIRRLSGSVVPGLANLGWRAYQAASLEARVPSPANLMVSNVPGAPIPLYAAGARITAMYPVPPLMPSQGLNITVMSYLDAVDVGFIVDRELVPDPWAMADTVPRALDELVVATRARPKAAARTKPA